MIGGCNGIKRRISSISCHSSYNIGVFVGVYVTTIKFISQRIDELKEQSKNDKDELKDEMRRYNNVLSRLAVVENSASAAHHRIDELVR